MFSARNHPISPHPIFGFIDTVYRIAEELWVVDLIFICCTLMIAFSKTCKTRTNRRYCFMNLLKNQSFSLLSDVVRDYILALMNEDPTKRLTIEQASIGWNILIRKTKHDLILDRLGLYWDSLSYPVSTTEEDFLKYGDSYCVLYTSSLPNVTAHFQLH